MKKCSIQKLKYPLILLLVLTNSCSGQAKKQPTKPNPISAGQPRIIKTQGTDSYANIDCAIQDKTGKLWFGTTGEGIYCFDGKTFTNFKWEDGLANNNIGAILEDRAGNIWVGTTNGVCRYNGKTFVHFPLPGDVENKSFRTSVAVLCILEDKTGNIWLGTIHHGVYRYDGKSFTNFLSNEVVKCILEDRNGNIWLGSWSRGGAYCYAGNRAGNACLKNSCQHNSNIPKDLASHTQVIAKSFTNFNVQNGLGDDIIASIIEDRSGKIFFGTRDRGVFAFDGKSFSNLTEKSPLENSCVYSMMEDKKGLIWMGTDGKGGSDGDGVYCYDGKNYVNYTKKDGLSNNNVFTILEDKEGNIWFGTRNVGLSRYNKKTFTDFSDRASQK